MKNKLFLVIVATLFLLTSQLLAEENVEQEKNISVKTFNISNQQELYNSLKRIYFSAEHKNILDTNWTGLHLSKRVTTGFIDIDVEVQEVLLTTKSFNDSDAKEMSVKIFTTQNDEVTHYEADSFLHKLFWNRVEYILGLEDEWLDCYHLTAALGNNDHLLCSASEQKAIQEIKAYIKP